MNPSEKLIEKLIKCGFIKGVFSKDLDSKNSINSINWTEEGKAALKLLAIYKSFGPIEAQECELLSAFASQMFHVQPKDPPQR